MLSMPLVTPTNVADNRAVQDLQAVTETIPSSSGVEVLNVDNKASSIPEHKISQDGHAVLPAGSVASSIISMVHPMTVNTMSENAAGEIHGHPQTKNKAVNL